MKTEDELMRGQFDRRIGNLAQALRDLAERVEQEGRAINRVGRPGTPSAGVVASSVVRAVAWGIANASVDGVVEAAADYDAFRARKD